MDILTRSYSTYEGDSTVLNSFFFLWLNVRLDKQVRKTEKFCSWPKQIRHTFLVQLALRHQKKICFLFTRQHILRDFRFFVEKAQSLGFNEM